MNALKYECGYFSEGYCTIFFYIVYFMYLLYILCIGSSDCYWNNAEEMMCVISTDLLAILEQTWKKKTLDFLLQDGNIQTQECDFADDVWC